MTLHRHLTPLRRALTVLLVALPLTLSTVATSPSLAGQKHGRRDLTVMTQNLYLGASLQAAVAARSEAEALAAVATIYGTAQRTDFPARSQALAEEIEHRRPDLIGLQEVSLWTVTEATGDPQVLDFLEVLLQDLEDEGMSYSVAAVSDNASIGPVPLIEPCAGPLGSCLLSFQDRDVILVNDDTRSLRVLSSDHGRYAAQVVLQTAVGPLPFDRGWASVDAKYRGKRFRFLNTHLETDVFAAVQAQQAMELLAGPAASRRRVIAVGDFNSPADGSRTISYALLTDSFFRDAWRSGRRDPGLTCCRSELLDAPDSVLSTRIDLVLTHGRVSARRTRVVGERPFQRVAPYWISDHAGVVSRVRLR